ncbi:hypothetical protein [Rubritalea tangerina]
MEVPPEVKREVIDCFQTQLSGAKPTGLELLGETQECFLDE